EEASFAGRNPHSRALAERARGGLYGGVPMHWMADWSTPFQLFVREAQGASFTDVDGHAYADFCLGDTGAMFGHSPAPVAAAIREQATRGYTTMLPGEDAVWIGEELGRRFGLPFWQFTNTATDANRAVMRWARGVTGRPMILVFDGCYHGAVDETLLRLGAEGNAVHRSGLIGQVQDLGAFMRVVPFNDLAALGRELARGDIAAVLCEPAMTNIGMVLPDPGYHAELRRLTRAHGTLLIIDETHTISTGPGGYTRAFGLEPDMLVMGKPIAGGIPCAVFGVSAAVAEGMRGAQQHAASAGGHGHSGMGTTLSAHAFTLHAVRANLAEVMTEAAYAAMIPRAERMANNLRTVIAARGLPWSVTQLGARIEFQFCAEPPRTGREAEAAFDDELERFLHLSLLNRGVLITPFHNMMLVCPHTERGDTDALVAAFAASTDLLFAQEDS
ncbi:MAG: aspartate aminotransferase family protein, partial [Gammaproteobacteria bacterium]